MSVPTFEETMQQRIEHLERTVSEQAKSMAKLLDASSGSKEVLLSRTASTPTDETSFGTICFGYASDGFCHKFYFSHIDKSGKAFAGFLNYEYGEYLHPIQFDQAEILIGEDIRHRAFLNVPKMYKYFTVNDDGTGVVWKQKPTLTINGRHYNASDPDTGLCVGKFMQYAGLYQTLLISRHNE